MVKPAEAEGRVLREEQGSMRTVVGREGQIAHPGLPEAVLCDRRRGDILIAARLGSMV